VIREKTDDDRPLIGAQRRGQRVCHAVDSSSGHLVPGHFAGVKNSSSPHRTGSAA
jgi:hypothetical protein